MVLIAESKDSEFGSEDRAELGRGAKPVKADVHQQHDGPFAFFE